MHLQQRYHKAGGEDPLEEPEQLSTLESKASPPILDSPETVSQVDFAETAAQVDTLEQSMAVLLRRSTHVWKPPDWLM